MSKLTLIQQEVKMMMATYDNSFDESDFDV